MYYVSKFAYKIFGDFVDVVKPYFTDISDDIQKANMKYILEEYISLAIFITTITFFAETIILSFIFGFIMNPVIAVILSVLMSVALSGALFFLFYTFPSTSAKNRSYKINKVLPFVSSYLTAIASGSAVPLTIFKTLSKFKEYGEITKESEGLVRDMEILGMNFFTALKRRAKLSPSAEWRDFLWGINETIASGSNLQAFLMEKNNELMNEYKRRIKKYAQDLSLFMEIYLTLVIIGSIFFIVLTSIIATMSSGLEILLIQTFIVFILLPLISIAFVLVIKTMSPTG